MEKAETDIIEELTALAQGLPEDKCQQLLDMIASWREDGRLSPREFYTELVDFVSSTGAHCGRARDISGTGVFIETQAGLDIGDQISPKLTFISAPNPVKIAGTVVRTSDVGVAVCFDQHSRALIARLDDIISKHALIMHPPRG